MLAEQMRCGIFLASPASRVVPEIIMGQWIRCPFAAPSASHP